MSVELNHFEVVWKDSKRNNYNQTIRPKYGPAGAIGSFVHTRQKGRIQMRTHSPRDRLCDVGCTFAQNTSFWYLFNVQGNSLCRRLGDHCARQRTNCKPSSDNIFKFVIRTAQLRRRLRPSLADQSGFSRVFIGQFTSRSKRVIFVE